MTASRASILGPKFSGQDLQPFLPIEFMATTLAQLGSFTSQARAGTKQQAPWTSLKLYVRNLTCLFNIGYPVRRGLREQEF
jgi:hypothetical protein